MGRSARVSMANAAVRREGGLGGRHVAVVLGILVRRQEGDRVRCPRGRPSVHGGHMDVGVAGQRTAAVALGATGDGVGAGSCDDGRIEGDGAAGQLIGRGACGHTVNRLGVEVLEVRQGPCGAVGHVVAGGACDGVSGVRSIVTAHAVPAEGVIELGGDARTGGNAVAGQALSGRVDETVLPAGRGLAPMAPDIGAGERAGDEGRSPTRLGGEDRIDDHRGWPGRDSDPGIGVSVVGDAPGATAGMAGVAGELGGQFHVLGVRTGDAGEGRSARSLGQPRGARVTGQAGAGARGGHRGVGFGMALTAQGGGAVRGGPRVGMAGGAVRGKGRCGHRHMAIELGVGLTRQEGNGVRGGVGVMAEGGVVAARLGRRGGRRGGMPDGIVSRTRQVALGTDGSVRRVSCGVGESGGCTEAPGLRRMGGADAVAGAAGVGRGAAGEGGAVAELTRNQAAGGHHTGGHLGANAMNSGVRPAAHRLVVAVGGHAGGHTTSHLEHAELVAPRAVRDLRYGRPGMVGDPAGHMIAPVVLGSRCGATARAAAQEAQGQAQQTGQDAEEL